MSDHIDRGPGFTHHDEKNGTQCPCRRETITLRRISRKDHLKQLNKELKQTPKWRFLRRMTLKHIITVLGGRYE